MDVLIDRLAQAIHAAQHPHHIEEVGPDAMDQFYLARVAVEALGLREEQHPGKWNLFGDHLSVNERRFVTEWEPNEEAQ